MIEGAHELQHHRRCCLQCTDAKIRCDKRWPSCGSCLLRKKECWYVGAPQPTLQAAPVLRELRFVGQQFGAIEMVLLCTYMTESSSVVRCPLPMLTQARSSTSSQDGNTWSTSITPREAAAHATSWAAICVGALLRRNRNADNYLGNAIQAARQCYDVPCLETLTALIAITYAAFLTEKFHVLALFAGYVEILCAELLLDAAMHVQVRYISWLLYISTSCTKTIRIQADLEFDRAAQTPAQALSSYFFESMIIPSLQCPITEEQGRMARKMVAALENSLDVVLRNRVTGDHAEIHVALVQLFLLSLWAGETHKLPALAKQLVEISCEHPMMLHTRHWYFYAIACAKYLLRRGEVEVATKMWDCLNSFRPLKVEKLGPLPTPIETHIYVSRGGGGGDQESDIQFLSPIVTRLMLGEPV